MVELIPAIRESFLKSVLAFELAIPHDRKRRRISLVPVLVMRSREHRPFFPATLEAINISFEFRATSASNNASQILRKEGTNFGKK